MIRSAAKGILPQEDLDYLLKGSMAHRDEKLKDPLSRPSGLRSREFNDLPRHVPNLRTHSAKANLVSIRVFEDRAEYYDSITN